jgi:hypothetical protein
MRRATRHTWLMSQTILHFIDNDGTDAHITATSITSIARLPAGKHFHDGAPIPERTRVTSEGGGLIIVHDSADDYARNVAAWRAAVA